MDSEEEARRFLNDIKTLFGERNCYYLVSVSEDAMSAFERRGMPFRDVFDSSFDTVVRVLPLQAVESALLLRRRVVGFGTAAYLLCHTLSGGWPRDLIRAARDVSDHASRGKTQLADLLWPLANARMRSSQQAAAIVASRHIQADGTQPLLGFLDGLPELADGNMEALRARWRVDGLLGELAASKLRVAARRSPLAARQELSLVAVQLAALAYHTATVIDYFSDMTKDQLAACHAVVNAELERLEASPEEADSETLAAAELAPVELLAQARRDMMLAPQLTWTTVSKVRAIPEAFPSAPTEGPLSGVTALREAEG
jgi:hypothetical protein